MNTVFTQKDGLFASVQEEGKNIWESSSGSAKPYTISKAARKRNKSVSL